MYFRIFYRKLPHLIDEVRKNTLPINEILKRIKPLFDDFSNESNKFYISYKNNGCPTPKEIRIFECYKALNRTFRNFIDVCLTIINDYDGSAKKYFANAKYKPISKSTFYANKKFFTKLSYKQLIVWHNYFPKSKKPKNIHHKYSPYIRKMICDDYFSYDETDPNVFQNFTTYWKELTDGKRLKQYDDFSEMSTRTLRKILQADPRYKKRPKAPKKDHPLRDKPKPPGHAQMDVKVFGKRQTGIGWYVMCFDCIDTQTRIPYSEILRHATIKQVMEVVEKARIFYEKLGIKLTLVRTDNAMMFKNTNFVNCNEFNNWCKVNHIKHQFTPLGEPQADGCVERYHKNMDDELVPKLKHLYTYEDIQICLQKYTHWCTYKKYVYFSELKDLPYKERFMIPFEAIDFFKRYKKTKQ